MELARFFILFGIIFLVIGVILFVFKGSIPRLPGDILIKRDGFAFYFPIISSIIISIILTIIFNFLNRK